MRMPIKNEYGEIIGSYDHELDACETELRIARTSQAESNAEVERLRAELETERMRLVACSVIALANTPESAASARGMHPDYQSPYCDDVARAVDREIALRAELAEYKRDAERYRTALEQIVAPFEDLNFVSGNKLLTYIHDVATAALAAKEEKPKMCSREQGFYQTGETEMTAKQTPLVDLLRIHADDIHSAHGHNKSSTLLSQAADRIAALEAERDQLLNEIQLITAPHDSVGAVIAGIRAERDQLRAELAECKRDAERYRWLRSESCPWPGVFSIEGADDYGWYAICEGDLDQAIDDALAAKMPDAPETLPDCRTCYYISGTIGEEWCSLLREDCRNGSNYVARWGIDPVRLYQPTEDTMTHKRDVAAKEGEW